MKAPATGTARPVGAPLLASIPHSSTLIPQSVRKTLVLNDTALEQELLWMTDWYVDELFSCVAGVGGIAAIYDYSRLVVDPERFEDDSREVMSSKGQGVIYTHTSGGDTLREHVPSEQEREELLGRYYRPYHRALETGTQHLLDSFGKCLILDCHSFPSRPLPCELIQGPDRPDICLGTDPSHTPTELVESVEAFFSERGLTTAQNVPFEGTCVPLKFLGSDERVSSLMIEVNRKLYINERAGEKLGSFGSLRDTMRDLVQAVVAELRSCTEERGTSNSERSAGRG